MQHHATRIERLRVFHLAAFLENQLQDVADVFVRAKHVCLYNRFPNFLDHARIGQVRWVVDQQFFAARSQHFIDDTWARGDDVHVVFAPEPFLDDFHVKQTQESAAKSEPKGDGTFRRVNKRGVVQTQLSNGSL